MTRSKYGNRKVELDGEKFDSAAERDRWVSLRLMERAGEVQFLRRQVRFHLLGADGSHICDYIADFVYCRNGTPVIEDVKGVITDVFRIKAKLMAAQGTPVTIWRKKNDRRK